MRELGHDLLERAADLVFCGPFGNYPVAFLSLPCLIGPAFRFGPRGAATATLLLAAPAIWGTLNGSGPFFRESPNESLLLLQAFLGVSAVSALALGALVVERRRIAESLREQGERPSRSCALRLHCHVHVGRHTIRSLLVRHPQLEPVGPFL